LADLGQFDFIWVRFVLEYHLEGAADIIRNLAKSLKPDGCLSLLDLDYNCLSHYPVPQEMDAILKKLVDRMARKYNFDPFVGRKLYTYLYDLGFRDIEVNLIPHHLIYGELRSSDDFNWIKKLQMASVKASDLFEAYPGGFDAFFNDFTSFFHDTRRFTYTPLIMCKGKRPVAV
ncbi:MAG: methyltransferase type 11, partial [Syntrophaceae bacterium]